jgi:hypothetical protein
MIAIMSEAVYEVIHLQFTPSTHIMIGDAMTSSDGRRACCEDRWDDIDKAWLVEQGCTMYDNWPADWETV